MRIRDYKIALTEQPAQLVLCSRFRTSVEKLPDELGKIYREIIKYVEGIENVIPDSAYAAYFNMDMKDLDVEAGFTINKAVLGKGSIEKGEVPAGMQVACMYKGPYAGCAETYKKMEEWMKENNCVPTGVVYEFYLNSPEDVAESELLTKVMFPVK